jgi:hypothetical protein
MPTRRYAAYSVVAFGGGMTPQSIDPTFQPLAEERTAYARTLHDAWTDAYLAWTRADPDEAQELDDIMAAIEEQAFALYQDLDMLAAWAIRADPKSPVSDDPKSAASGDPKSRVAS